MRKFLTLLLSIFLLTACTSKGSNFVVERDYIQPTTKETLYDRLSDDLKKIFNHMNRKNYIFKDIGMPLTDLTVKDYYGNDIDFSAYKNGNLIIEVSAYWCSHCSSQTANNEKILENSDANIIQFFIEGDKELVKEFYESENIEMPSDITIITENKDLENYFVESEIEMVPTFYFFKDGHLTFINVGTFTYEEYENIKDYIFGEKALNKESLVDNMGNSIFDGYREFDDVLNDLSASSKDKLALIENSEELTISIIGKDVGFNKLYEEENGAIFRIKDFSKYENKELAVFYIGNVYNNLTADIKLINEFKDLHQDLNVLTILVDSKDISTSDVYKNLDTKLKTDVVSSNSEIPQMFIDTLINEYPAMLFIQDNKFTGGFYNLESIDKMEKAYSIFMNDDSIALLDNNKNSH